MFLASALSEHLSDPEYLHREFRFEPAPKPQSEEHHHEEEHDHD